MDEITRKRVEEFLPPDTPLTGPKTPRERQQAVQIKYDMLQAREDKKNAIELAKIKAAARRKLEAEKLKGKEDSASAQEAARKIELVEAIEVAAKEDEAPQRAIAAHIDKSDAAKELLAMQGTTRADVRRLLASLNINMNLQLTKTDTANLLACLLTCNEQQLAALESNPKVPLAIKIVIKRLREDAKAGSMAALERLWDRVFGKAQMSLDLPEQATAAGIIPNTPISREAYIVIRDTLIK